MLRTVGNIVTGDNAQTQTMLDGGIILSLLGLLSHSNKGIRKEACWALSNIAAGTSDQIQAIMEVKRH